MKARTLYILLASTLVLGGFILFFEKDLPSTDERQEQARKVVPLAVEDIESMLIESPAGSLRFERRDQPSEDGSDVDADDPLRTVSWYLTQPLEARADGIAVAGLLRSLTDLESDQRLDEIDPATAGLDDPVAKVTLQTASGVSVLSFGAMVPTSDNRIVAIEGEPGAHVAPASVLDTLQRSTGDWRDKKLITGAQSEIRRVVLEASSQRLVLESRDGDVWITEPLLDRADADRVDALFAALVGLQAASFVESPPGETPSFDQAGLGLEPPRVRLQVTFEEGEDVEILLGDAVQPGPREVGLQEITQREVAPHEVYGKVGDQWVTVDGAALQEWVDLPATAWQETAWSRLQVFQVEGAEITSGTGEGTMTLARQGTDWSRDGEIVEYSVVSDLLYAIAETEAVEVLDRSAAAERGLALQELALREAALSVHLLATEGDEELRLWPAVGDVHPATVGDRDVLMLLAAETVADLQHLVDAVADAAAPQPTASQPPGAVPRDEISSGDSSP